jgi:hypothetical protein
MADVTVNVDGSGSANNPGVKQGQTIQWILDSGVAGPYSLHPPPNMFHNDDNPACFTLSSSTPDSPTYTVKQSASTGGHTYSIGAGACTGKSKKPTTGVQTITVNTSLGHHKKAAAHRGK